MGTNTGVDVAGEAVKDAAAAAASQAVIAQKQISDLTNSFNSTTDNIIQALFGGTQQGETPASLATKLQGQLEAQQSNRKLYETLAGGQGFADFKLAQMEQLQATMAEAQQMSTELDKKEAIGLFDDPMQWMLNQITLPDERNALNSKLSKAEVIKKRIDYTNSIMQADAVTENAYKLSMDAASNKTLVDALQRDIEKKTLDSKQDAIKFNFAAVKEATNLTRDQLAIAQAGLQAEVTIEHLAIAHQGETERLARFDAWVKENKDKEDFNIQATSWYNKGADLAGVPQLTSNKISNLLKSGGDQSKRVQEIMFAGQQALESGKDVAGHSPWNAQNFLQVTKNQIPLNEQYARDALDYANTTVDTLIAANRLKGKDNKEVISTFNREVSKYLLDKQSPVKYTDTTSPYILPTPQAFAADSPAITSTPLWQKVLAQETNTFVLTTSDPNQIIKAAIAGYKKGYVTIPEVIDGLATYYSAGVEINNALRRFSYYGMPEQKGYKAEITVLSELGESLLSKVNPFSGRSKVEVDMTDRTAIGNLVTRMIAAEGYTAFQKR